MCEYVCVCVCEHVCVATRQNVIGHVIGPVSSVRKTASQSEQSRWASDFLQLHLVYMNLTETINAVLHFFTHFFIFYVS